MFSGDGNAGDHDRITVVAVFAQTLWVDPEQLRCEIRQMNGTPQTRGTRRHSWHLDIRRGYLELTWTWRVV